MKINYSLYFIVLFVTHPPFHQESLPEPELKPKDEKEGKVPEKKGVMGAISSGFSLLSGGGMFGGLSKNNKE